MKSLEGKVAIVTGATSGIGRASATALAAAGAKVALAGRREAEGNTVAEEVRRAGGEALFVRTDVADEAQVKALVDAAVDRFGRLDIAFNNAGVEGHPKPVTEVDADDYHFTFDINVGGVLWAMRYEIPAMLAGGGGSIINTSSVLGHRGIAGAGVYSASKHAVEGLTKTAALEVSAQGVRVNSVAPAVIETAMFDRFSGGDADAKEYMRSLHPIGRFGQPSEIADVVVWLAGDASSFVTGQSISVDGGWQAK
jgi:NAD(P)-dependent dehydrogenase (short-subunit alcohol dehydrogenase family)